MKRRVRLFWILFGCVLGGLSTPVIANDDGPWFPVSRNQLLVITAESLSAESLALQTFEDFYESQKNASNGNSRFLKHLRIELSKSRNKGYTGWRAVGSNLPFAMFLAGRENRIHTIKIFYNAANGGDHDTVIGTVSRLYNAIFSGLKEVEEFAKNSAEAAWNTDRAGTIVKKKANGIVSSTFGIPGRVLVFSVTTKTGCIPSFDFGKNPYKPLIC